MFMEKSPHVASLLGVRIVVRDVARYHEDFFFSLFEGRGFFSEFGKWEEGEQDT